MDSKEGEVATGVILEKVNFTWRIANFDIIRHADELILAQEFNFSCGKSIRFLTEWKVRLEANKEKGDENWIGIFLWCTKKPKNMKNVHGNAQYSIISGNNDKKFGNLEPKSMHDYGATNQGWGFPTFIRKEGNTKDLPLVDGSLVVGIEFHLYATAFAPPMLTNTPITTESLIEKFKPIFMKKLQSDFKDIDISSESSDGKVKIISSDKTEFGVSAAILSARSPVFKKALQVDMEEAKTAVISIDDLSSTPITVLLRFIYTGTLHAEWSKEDVVVPLVYAAEKYELLDLKDFLDNVLGKVCCTENAGKLLNLAGKIGMKKAAKEILERIKEDFSNHDDMVAVISAGSELDF